MASKHERAAATRARAISKTTAAATVKAVNARKRPLRRLSEEQADLVRSTRAAADQVRLGTWQVDRGIVAMRAAGMTWPQVASALDVSRQAAQKRYATLVAPNPAD